MTLSRFLRGYVYIPLGGNRRGLVRRHGNLMVTMLIGGLWHGAGWTFVVWGGLHGLYLMINHFWRWLRPQLGIRSGSRAGWVERRVCHVLTFLAVVVAWVFFRALSFDGAMTMLKGMVGLNGIALPAVIAHRTGPIADMLAGLGIRFEIGGGSEFLLVWAWIVGLALIAFLLPNTQQLMCRYRPALDLGAVRRSRWNWRPSLRWATATAALLILGVLSLPEVSVFLYFQF